MVRHTAKSCDSGRAGRGRVLALILLLGICLPSSAAEQRILSIETPPRSGEYRVVGSFFFNPGALNSPDQVRILALPVSNSVETFLLESEDWPGGGVMRVTLGFAATSDDLRRHKYAVEWGGAGGFSAANPTGLPELRMTIDEQAPAGDPTVPVGTLIVKVRQHPEIYYYWYLLPISAIVALLLYRKRKFFTD